MIVLDASAAVELILRKPAAVRIKEILAANLPIAVPAHFEAEAFAAVRRLLLQRAIESPRAGLAVRDLAALPGARVPLAPLLGRAFALRDRFEAHDVFYVALAEAARASVLTCDARLARALSGWLTTHFVLPRTDA
ncbi:MAG: type II toxin-antitoxin system VapC family toxin [Candidatus Limnocylindria bacterium]